MNMQHALRPADRDRVPSQPDALARYRLSADAVAAARASLLRPGSVGLAHRLWRAVTAAAATWRLWRERAYSRKNLAELDPRMLRDIGVSPSQIWHEANKPFWRE
jgi:uncharacterized protein YjiS (DUF1127 family)